MYKYIPVFLCFFSKSCSLYSFFIFFPSRGVEFDEIKTDVEKLEDKI